MSRMAAAGIRSKSIILCCLLRVDDYQASDLYSWNYSLTNVGISGPRLFTIYFVIILNRFHIQQTHKHRKLSLWAADTTTTTEKQPNLADILFFDTQTRMSLHTTRAAKKKKRGESVCVVVIDCVENQYHQSRWWIESKWNEGFVARWPWTTLR